MLKLRLSMGGTKKRPVYKIVVADSKFARDGRFIEKLGFFNPLLPKEKKVRVGLESERIKYWLSKGAQPTIRVARILGENQIISMPKNSNNPLKAIPKVCTLPLVEILLGVELAIVADPPLTDKAKSLISTAPLPRVVL